MQFLVQSYGSTVPSGPEALVLETDDWDDFGYRTMHHLWYRTPTDTWNLGPVKIAVTGQEVGAIPFEYGRYDDGLPGEFFSLGQSDDYYDEIRKLGRDKRVEILEALCDLAYFPNRLQDAKQHRVTDVSLLRSVEEQTVRAQFNRIARGGVRLTEYRFRYDAPGQDASGGVDFQVVPESSPSSNIHVLIGRNGVGKTTLLRNLAGAVARPDLDGRFGSVAMLPTSASEAGEQFANVVSVTFSAFDPFVDIESLAPDVDNVSPRATSYVYVGLRGGVDHNFFVEDRTTLQDGLRRDFNAALTEVFTSRTLTDWREAMLLLSRDPQFADSGIASFARNIRAGMRLRPNQVEDLTSDFSQLSSGHAIVALTMTQLVQSVAEQSLVLLDEPEAHLHPPLLASFMQALSKLLTDRNGVAVVATHSPVVLQTAPRSCVYKLIRYGETSRFERPLIETYGENVGALTHEVFGLEVMHSGFYAEITKAVTRMDSYEQVLTHFGGQLGSEARGLVRILLAEKTNRGV
ncbi:AAA family ATPase [Streptomyces sp. NPDC058249]|uniref:AAA family ATPase n=1 Tax=Streptomyces sp. NPDC058249 TaxID=3346403 RepID=UPI0036E55554